MMYRITKRFNPGKGYPCAFRNHRARSHCRWLHGYDLIFEVTFESEVLDIIGHVVDFGNLGYIKDRLTQHFDHKTIVAEDDPYKDEICALAGIDVLDAVVLPQVGCEAFATWLAVEATDQLQMMNLLGRVRVHSARVYEHEGNMAEYLPTHPESKNESNT